MIVGKDTEIKFSQSFDEALIKLIIFNDLVVKRFQLHELKINHPKNCKGKFDLKKKFLVICMMSQIRCHPHNSNLIFYNIT